MADIMRVIRRHLLRSLGRRRLRAAPLLLLLSLLPTLTYIGHWGGEASEATMSAPHGDEEAASHRAHCHFGPASCSEQPAPPNLRAFPHLIELPTPDLPAVPIDSAVALYSEFIPAPPEQPPRSS